MWYFGFPGFGEILKTIWLCLSDPLNLVSIVHTFTGALAVCSRTFASHRRECASMNASAELFWLAAGVFIELYSSLRAYIEKWHHRSLCLGTSITFAWALIPLIKFNINIIIRSCLVIAFINDTWHTFIHIQK